MTIAVLRTIGDRIMYRKPSTRSATGWKDAAAAGRSSTWMRIRSNADTANDAAFNANAPCVPATATSAAPTAGPAMIARWYVPVSTPFAVTRSSPRTSLGTVAIMAGWNTERQAPRIAATAATWSHAEPPDRRSDATATQRMRSARTMTRMRGYRSTIGPAIVMPTTAEVSPSIPKNSAVARTSVGPSSVAAKPICTAITYAQSPRFDTTCATHRRRNCGSRSRWKKRTADRGVVPTPPDPSPASRFRPTPSVSAREPFPEGETASCSMITASACTGWAWSCSARSPSWACTDSPSGDTSHRPSPGTCAAGGAAGPLDPALTFMGASCGAGVTRA